MGAMIREGCKAGITKSEGKMAPSWAARKSRHCHKVYTATKSPSKTRHISAKIRGSMTLKKQLLVQPWPRPGL